MDRAHGRKRTCSLDTVPLTALPIITQKSRKDAPVAHSGERRDTLPVPGVVEPRVLYTHVIHVMVQNWMRRIVLVSLGLLPNLTQFLAIHHIIGSRRMIHGTAALRTSNGHALSVGLLWMHTNAITSQNPAVATAKKVISINQVSETVV